MRTTYQPTNVLLEGIRSLFPLEMCPWDDYFIAMAQADYLLGNHEQLASKTFFIRKAPFGGSFALLGGLTHFLRVLEDFQFDGEVSAALKDQGYEKNFITYLTTRHKTIEVDVYAPPEGSIILPNECAVIIEGDLLSVRIAEGILTKCMNFPTLSLTKWYRACSAAAPGNIMEFSRRRAQDDLRTSLYAKLAGVAISSNSEIRRAFNIKVKGTMGHEWIQSFGDEYEAFDKWLEVNPHKPVLLVDTIDTLKSGVPNAIKAFKKHWDRIKEAKGVPGIRNDSGDLAYITIEECRMFNAAGMEEILIFETNDLDEYSIQSIKEQIFTYAPKAGLDPTDVLERVVFACGTKPGTCYDQPSIGGVMKLTSIVKSKRDKAVIKLARDNPIKTSIPGSNRSVYIFEKNMDFVCCLIYNSSERWGTITKAHHPDDPNKTIDLSYHKRIFFPRQELVYSQQTGIADDVVNKTLSDIALRVKEDTNRIHWTHKRFDNPHKLKVSLSPSVFKLRTKMIKEGKLIED